VASISTTRSTCEQCTSWTHTVNYYLYALWLKTECPWQTFTANWVNEQFWTEYICCKVVHLNAYILQGSTETQRGQVVLFMQFICEGNGEELPKLVDSCQSCCTNKSGKFLWPTVYNLSSRHRKTAHLTSWAYKIHNTNQTNKTAEWSQALHTHIYKHKLTYTHICMHVYIHKHEIYTVHRMHCQSVYTVHNIIHTRSVYNKNMRPASILLMTASVSIQ